MSGENAKSEEARKNETPDRNLHGVPEICINKPKRTRMGC